MQGIGYKGAKTLRELKEMKVLSPGPGSCLCPGGCGPLPSCSPAAPMGTWGSAALQLLLEVPLLEALPGANPSPSSLPASLPRVSPIGCQWQESLGNVVFRFSSGGSQAWRVGH